MNLPFNEIPIKSEIYIRENFSEEFSRVRIYSHVKREVVYDSVRPAWDIMPLLDDLHVKPENTIIHILTNHKAYPELVKAGFVTRQSIFTL